MGFDSALIGNIGFMEMAKEAGLALRGDYGLNVFNSVSLQVLRDLGFRSATVSFELMLRQAGALSKYLDTELVVYGRLPLMVTENCTVRNVTGVCSCDRFSGLTDRSGLTFPILKDYGCRNQLLNSKKLFLADRQSDYMELGLWGARLLFTTENSREVLSVAERYLGRSTYAPGAVTRGLYYRGVE